MKTKVLSALKFVAKSVLIVLIGTACIGAMHGFYDGIMGHPPKP